MIIAPRIWARRQMGYTRWFADCIIKGFPFMVSDSSAISRMAGVSPKDHRANVRRLEELGLDWQITECDIRIKLDEAGPTAAQLAEQAQGYSDLAGLCLAGARCRGLVLWGFTDKHSWIPGFRTGWGAALPFDADYRPKPAYEALAATFWGRSPAE